MTPPDMKPKDRALLAFDKINEKLERDCGAAATFIGTKEYEWIETACVESAIAAREEGRKEGMEAGFNDGLVMAKLALLEMDECEEMSHGGCSCSTIQPAIRKLEEIRQLAKKEKGEKC